MIPVLSIQEASIQATPKKEGCKEKEGNKTQKWKANSWELNNLKYKMKWILSNRAKNASKFNVVWCCVVWCNGMLYVTLSLIHFPVQSFRQSTNQPISSCWQSCWVEYYTNDLLEKSIACSNNFTEKNFNCGE